MEKAHFLIVNLGLQYLIPLSIIALFYILILKKIAERKLPKLARHLPSNVKDGNRQSSLVIERSKVKVSWGFDYSLRFRKGFNRFFPFDSKGVQNVDCPRTAVRTKLATIVYDIFHHQNWPST